MKICPYCKHSIPLATALHGSKTKPVNGDISMCINCGKFGTFKDDGFEKLDIETLPQYVKDEVKRVKKAWDILKLRTELEDSK